MRGMARESCWKAGPRACGSVVLASSTTLPGSDARFMLVMTCVTMSKVGRDGGGAQCWQ